MDLPGSERVAAEGARPLGAPRPDERLEVTLLLRRRTDLAPYPSVADLGRQPLAIRAYLSRAEFAARHGLHPKDRETVLAFAASNGLTLVAESRAARTLRLAGPLRVFEATFDVRLERWVGAGGSYRGRVGPVRLPPELEGIVVGVFGLDSRPAAAPHCRRRTATLATDRAYAPPTVADAYAFPAGTTGAGATIGLLELGGGFAPSDLATYFSRLGLPTPDVRVVSVDGATNAPTGVPDGPDGEVELDIEVAGSTAPGARLVVYFAPNTEQGFVDGLATAVHDAANAPSVVSVSWGSSELTWTSQARAAISSIAEDAGALGVTVTVASGDGGASDGGPAGTLAVDFPASSPWVLGCGGTRLLLSGAAIVDETAWNDLATGEGATGGGVSQEFELPAYQTNAGVPTSPRGRSGRGVPDVSGDADPATGYAVEVDGAASVFGGTSAVAPLWAALIARLHEALGRPLGFVNPILYSAPARTGFHDITSGSNGGYSAGPGWDPCTGLGTPDGAKLVQALREPAPTS